MEIRDKIVEIGEQLLAKAVEIIEDCKKDIMVMHGNTREILSLLLPSGDMKYKAFWVRDCAMMCESGLLSVEEMKVYIDFIARFGQNGGEVREFTNGRFAQPWAVTDHISYRCKPTFFPGNYKDDETQGDEAFGLYPPLCDAYYWVTLVAEYIKRSGDTQFLTKEYDGLTLYERLKRGFFSNPAREDTGLSYTTDEKISIDWGFTDSIFKSGDLLFSSILRWRAAKAMSTFASFLESGDEGEFAEIADKIRENLGKTFFDEKTGWLYAATEHCRQHDVWGTAFAVECGILDEQTEKAACAAIYKAYKQGTATKHGYVRHILTDEDWSKESAWERPSTPLGWYQNGGYWATPTGWFATALFRHDKEACVEFLEEFLSFTKARGGELYEWFNLEKEKYDGVNYGTSAALPYLSVRNLLNEV